MAIKGLTTPVIGDYNFNGSKASYTNGFVCAHAIEYGVDVEASDNNPLFGDDRIIENDYGKFSSGTLTLNTSDLDQESSKNILGLKEVQRQVGERQVTELVYDDDAKQGPKGVGVIETHQIDDQNKYRAVVLCKCTPNFPAEAATTKGETIEWQTREIEFQIARSDEETTDYNHPWKYEAWFDTQAEAFEYLKAVLGVPEEETLKASAAGISEQKED